MAAQRKKEQEEAERKLNETKMMSSIRRGTFSPDFDDDGGDFDDDFASALGGRSNGSMARSFGADASGISIEAADKSGDDDDYFDDDF